MQLLTLVLVWTHHAGRGGSTQQLRSGKRVRSYEDLLDWLQEQSPGSQRAVLPGLEGRNVVIYHTR